MTIEAKHRRHRAKYYRYAIKCFICGTVALLHENSKPPIANSSRIWAVLYKKGWTNAETQVREQYGVTEFICPTCSEGWEAAEVLR